MSDLPRTLTFDRDEDFTAYSSAKMTDEKWQNFWKFMCERYQDWAVSNMELDDEDECDCDECDRKYNDNEGEE